MQRYVEIYGAQVFQDPVLPIWLTFLLFTLSFSINLGQSSSDLALHFNPRFNESTIVCNSMCSKTWQTEHRDNHLCFSKGSTIKVRAVPAWGCEGCVCGGEKPLVSRFPYISPPSPTQYLLLLSNSSSSSGVLALIAISTPSKPQHFLWELYVSPVCLRLCKCFLSPIPAEQVSAPGTYMKVKRVSKKQDLTALYLITLRNSLLCKHRL